MSNIKQRLREWACGGTNFNALLLEAATHIEGTEKQRDELLEALKMAHQSLRYAASDVADWGEYAGAYMRRKHGLADDIQAYTNAAESARAAIAKAEGGAA